METNTSQNSVATYEGVVGPLITTLLQIYYKIFKWKNFDLTEICPWVWCVVFLANPVHMTAMAINYLLMYRYCQFIQPFRYDPRTRQTPTRSNNPAMCYNMHAFSRQILETLTSHAFLVLPLSVAKLSTVNNNPSFFCPTVYIVTIVV